MAVAGAQEARNVEQCCRPDRTRTSKSVKKNRWCIGSCRRKEYTCTPSLLRRTCSHVVVGTCTYINMCTQSFVQEFKFFFFPDKN